MPALRLPAKASSARLLTSFSRTKERLHMNWSGALFLFIFYTDVVTGLDHCCKLKESFSLVPCEKYSTAFLALLFLTWTKDIVSVTALARD